MTGETGCGKSTQVWASIPPPGPAAGARRVPPHFPKCAFAASGPSPLSKSPSPLAPPSLVARPPQLPKFVMGGNNRVVVTQSRRIAAQCVPTGGPVP